MSVSAGGALRGLRGRTWPTRTRPSGEFVLAMLVTSLALCPLAYLAWRAGEGGERSLAALWHPRTGELLLRSVGLAITVAVTSALCGLPLAWITERVALPGRRVFAVLFALPLAVPSYLTAFALVAVLGPRGALADLLDRAVGLERLPEMYGFAGAWGTLTLVTFPYAYLSIRAALRGLDPTLEDAARVLGESRRAAFSLVTLPLLRPAIVAGMLLSALYALGDFGAIAVLRYPTLTYSIYNQYRLSFDRSAAATLALLLVVLSAAAVVAERRWRRRAVFYRSVGTRRPASLQPPTWWAWLVLGGGLSLVGLALGAPVSVAAYWWWRARVLSEDMPAVGQAFLNSLLVGFAAAVLTVCLALPVARVVSQSQTSFARLLDVPLWVAYSLPGIVLALSIVSLTARFLPFLYQTIPLLLLGYALRFLPEATGTLKAVFAQQNPRLEEAARTLGLRRWSIWWRVRLPLAFPGLVAALTLVFLTTVKELPITLLLSPIGFSTLVTVVWNATAEAYWTHAALPTLLLVAIGVIPMVLLGLWQERVQSGQGG
ncbi:Molybdenum transport system permease protein ModB [bacterium HR27]|nr:Molybdenum transport system permease protein ModB [bacterium HR27]